MRTAQQGNGSLSPLGQVGTAAHESVRVSVSREELIRRAGGAPRVPSSPEAVPDSTRNEIDEADEVLVRDARAGVSPAEMVEIKLRSLLRTRGISTELAGRARPRHGR